MFNILLSFKKACQYYVIDAIVVLTIISLLWPYFFSWNLSIQDFAAFPIFDSLRSLQYKISIYCSISISIPMILEQCVRVFLEPRLLTDFKTFLSNVFLFLSLILPDLIILIYAIPYFDLKLFNLAFEVRYVLLIWSLGKFLYIYGDNGFFRNTRFVFTFGALSVNRILVYFSRYFVYSQFDLLITKLVLFVSFASFGFEVIRWFRYIRKVSKEKSISTDQYLCNIYIISTTLVYVCMLVLSLIVNPSMDLLYGNDVFLAGMSYIFSLFYILIAVFQGRALQREAVIAKSTLEVKRMFLRYMSHEIRTPLNTVMLGLQFLQEDMKRNGDTHERLDVLQDIKRSCDVATKTLNDMLLYDKIETGALKLDRTNIKIVDFIKTTLQPFYIQALQEGIHLTLHFVHNYEVIGDSATTTTTTAANIPTTTNNNSTRTNRDGDDDDDEPWQTLTANIDTNKLAQVIRNLISNALKFTPKDGSVTVRVTVSRSNKMSSSSSSQQMQQQQSPLPPPAPPEEKEEKLLISPGDTLRIDVIDTGPGISMENQSQLFHGVTQFSPGEMQEGGGSGLGLYISKGIMDAHEGLITVASKGIGHGSTFSLQFPLTTVGPVNRSNKAPSRHQDQAQLPLQRPVVPPPPLQPVATRSSPKVAEGTDRKLWQREKTGGGSSVKVMSFEDVPEDDPENCDDVLDQRVDLKRNMAITRNSNSLCQLRQHPQYSRVLVVDDVAMNRKMLLRLLGNRDRFETYCEACNGQEAVNKVRDSISNGMTFDVITMDYQMPVMDGPRAAKAIRELGYRGIILGITGNALPEDIKTFLSHGVNDVLTKPIDMTTFDSVLLKCRKRNDAFI